MSFDSLYALHYDRFSGADYASYAAFFMEAARRFADVALREALDLGCGAGGLSAVLAGAGLDMVGLDVSPEMLSVARAKPENRDVLLLCQDMREMELYGTVQGAVSAYDCLNYLGACPSCRTCWRCCTITSSRAACSCSTSIRPPATSGCTPTTASASRTTARCWSGATNTRRNPAATVWN